MKSSHAETPMEAATRLFKAKVAEGFELVTTHEYQEANGHPIFWRTRLKRAADGEKAVLPIHHDGKRFKVGERKLPKGKKPLYRLPSLIALDRSSPVFITEGEQKVEALESLGLVATTSGGATSADGADWTPLAGRECIIWPDHDDVGQKYADAVVTILARLDCKIWIIQADEIGVQKSGDVVDWLEVNVQANADTILALPRRPVEGPISDAIEQGSDEVELIRGDMVKMIPMQWLWHGWLARGKIHLLAGEAGTGKTTLALWMAAAITQGGQWPDGSVSDAGDVVIWSGEDTIEDTIAPRLHAAGANMERVHFVAGRGKGERSRPFDPAKDLPKLGERLARVPNPLMLILDPIVSVVQGNSHNNVEVRQALQPVKDLADGKNVCVVGITHFSKGSAHKKTSDRVNGSVAYNAVARFVMATCTDQSPDNLEGWRVIARVKSNFKEHDGGFRYKVVTQVIQPANEAEIETSRIQWGDSVNGSADEIFAELEQSGESPRNATQWLRELLSSGGMLKADVLARAKEAGFTEKQVRNARERLQVITSKSGTFQGQSLWELPIPANRAQPRPTVPSIAPGMIGHDCDGMGSIGSTGSDPLDLSGGQMERFDN